MRRIDAGRLIACVISGALLIAACGGDSPAAPDARLMIPGDFSCIGVAPPTTAPDPLYLHGITLTDSGAPLAGIGVEIHAVAGDSLLAAMTSAAPDGDYASTIASGGVAPTIYRKATSTGFIDTYVYDAFPVSSGYGVTVWMETAADLDRFYEAAGIGRDPAKGTVWLDIYDCTSPLAGAHEEPGATVEAPSGQVVYLDNQGTPAPDRASSGTLGAMVFNVEPGELDFTVHVGPMTYRAWPIQVRAGVFTTSLRHP